MLSTEGVVGHYLGEEEYGTTTLFLFALDGKKSRSLKLYRRGQGQKKGLAIALLTATIASPHYHEACSSWHL